MKTKFLLILVVAVIQLKLNCMEEVAHRPQNTLPVIQILRCPQESPNKINLETATIIWSSEQVGCQWTMDMQTSTYQLHAPIKFINDEHVKAANKEIQAHNYGQLGITNREEPNIVNGFIFTLKFINTANLAYETNLEICTYLVKFDSKTQKSATDQYPIRRIYLSETADYICFVLNKNDELCFCMYGSRKTQILNYSKICKFKFCQ